MTLVDGKVILTQTEWEDLQKQIRKDANTMRRAASRIQRLEAELDELGELLEDDDIIEELENATVDPTPAATPSNVRSITNHPRWKRPSDR